MGGTSTDVALYAGQFERAFETEVAGVRMRAPMMAINTVAAGGGLTRNPAYYIIAHASKFVRPGAVRVATNLPADLPNVAFQRPDGKKVLIVLNNGSTVQNFNIQYRGKVVTTLLYAGSVGTYVW